MCPLVLVSWHTSQGNPFVALTCHEFQVRSLKKWHWQKSQCCLRSLKWNQKVLQALTMTLIKPPCMITSPDKNCIKYAEQRCDDKVKEVLFFTNMKEYYEYIWMSGTLFFAYENLCFSVCKMLALKNSFGLRSSLWCLYLCLCLWVKCGSNSAEYSTYLSSETPELLSECEMRDEWWALCTSEFIRPDSAVCDPVPLKAMYAHAIILPLLPFIPCFLFIMFGSMRHTKPFSTLFSSWLSDKGSLALYAQTMLFKDLSGFWRYFFWQ